MIIIKQLITLLVIFKKSDEKIELFNHKSANTPKINLKKMKKNILKNFNFKYDFFWGAAGKGVMVLNILNVNYNQVPYIVDILPPSYFETYFISHSHSEKDLEKTVDVFKKVLLSLF